MAASRFLHAPAEEIEILKWKVKKGSIVEVGAVLMTFKKSGGAELQKLRSEWNGTVAAIFKSEGSKVVASEKLMKLNEGCTHQMVIKDLCAQCGKDLREEQGSTAESGVTQIEPPRKSGFKRAAKANVSMVHSVPELVVSNQHAAEIGHKDIERLHRHKKLVLLVDLDQTLIHTTTDNIPNKLRGVHHFQMSGVWYHTMFRPGTREFLQNISKCYELHIVTYGVRLYAHRIASIIDECGKLFSHRILSRDELLDINTKKANLRSLFPCGEDMVCIIDDREDVWNYSSNIIPVVPYKFFTGTGDINAPGQKPPDPKTSTEKSVTSETTSNETSNNVSNTRRPTDTELTDSTNSSDTKTATDKPLIGSSKSSDTKPSTDKITDMTNSSNTKTPADKTLTGMTNSSTEEKSRTENNEASPSQTDPPSDLTETSCDTVEKSEVTCKEQADETLTSKKVEENPTDILTDGQKDRDQLTASETTDLKNDKLEEKTTTTSENEQTVEQNVGDSETRNTGDNKKLESRTSDKNESGDLKATGEPEEEKEVVWRDDDNYLQSLEKILISIHEEFYNSDKSNITVAKVISEKRHEVLEGCVLCFSGLFPQSTTLKQSTAYEVSVKLGATVVDNMSEQVTHLIASRLGTRKVRQAAQMNNCTIVHPDWLWLTWYRINRQNEIDHILTSKNEIPEPAKITNRNQPPTQCGNYDPSFGRKRKFQPEDSEQPSTSEERDLSESSNPAKKQRFSESFNPLMSIDKDEFSLMQGEIDDAFTDSDLDDSDVEKSADAKLRRKLCASSEDNDSDSDSSHESLSNDYPKGWSPPSSRRRGPGGTTPPDEHLNELQEEDYLRMQDQLENSPMEFDSEDSSDDDAMAAALDEAMYGSQDD